MRFSTRRTSTIAVVAALALGAALPVAAWGTSEDPAPAPTKKHECKTLKKHQKQTSKKHHKHRCKKPDGPKPVEPKPEPEPPKHKAKCNAGNGNGSDAVTFVEGEHCYGGDPGNSFNAGNRGGDEIPTTEPRGGVANPGGNNHPG